MRHTTRWGLAGAGSIAAHAVLASVVLLAVAPDDEPSESRSHGGVRIATHSIEETEARPEDPDAEAAAETAVAGDDLSQASVPVSRSRPVALAEDDPQAAMEPAGARVAPDAAAGEVLAALAAHRATAAEAAASGVMSRADDPAATALAAAEIQADGVDAVILPSEGTPAAAPGAEKLTAATATEAKTRPMRVRPDPAPAASPTVAAGKSLALHSPPAAALRDTVEVPHLALSETPAEVAAAGAVVAKSGALPAEVASPASVRARTVADVGASEATPSLSRVPSGVQVGAVNPVSVQAAGDSTEGRRVVGAPLAEEEGRPGALNSFDLAWTPPPRPRPADTVAPPEDRVLATLAWSGGAGADISPASLAAIQSFVHPGAAGADEVRDSVAKVLASIPCAQLQTAFVPETGNLELRGHVPEDSLRGPVLAALRDQVGDAITIADNVLVLPRPQCSMLSGVKATGLPQSTDQLTNPRIVGEDAHARVYDFVEGERLMLDVTGPDYDAYMYADYYDADGMVIHLQPNELVPLRRIGAAEAAEVGSEAAGRLELRVAPPFGQEIVVAMAASEPLYEGVRPMREPAGPYLQWLRDRVEETRLRHPGFKGEWVYFFVKTHAG